MSALEQRLAAAVLTWARNDRMQAEAVAEVLRRPGPDAWLALCFDYEQALHRVVIEGRPEVTRGPIAAFCAGQLAYARSMQADGAVGAEAGWRGYLDGDVLAIMDAAADLGVWTAPVDGVEAGTW